MISKLKNLTNSESKKRFISNLFALASLQGVNYILPLLTLPYLVRVLGPEYFGLLAFATATIIYFGLITDYGFNLTATRQISIHRHNKDKIIEIFSSVMTIKVLLMTFSLIVMSIIVFSFDKFSQHWEIYFLTFGTVIGQTLFPVWFFQGMERMKYSTYLNILSKSIFTIAIFAFVHNQNDYYLVPILTSIGFIIAGIWSLTLIKKDFDISFKIQSVESIKFYFMDGWHIFLTTFQSNILSSSGVFILGLFYSNTVVGYYAAVDKLLRAIAGIFAPITQAFFPLISAKLSHSKKEGQKLLLKVASYVMVMVVIAMSLMYLFADDIIYIVLGEEFVSYSYILKVLSIYFFFGMINNFTGIQYLTSIGKSKYYLKSFAISSLIAVTLYFTLTPLFAIYGILIGMITSEIALSVLMFYAIWKNSLWSNLKSEEEGEK
ncbi:flippase [Sulfuricurvum sp.]|uniref:flippase n=1 Tax=Sulfuricurvum sp. TaxID=2025608 RepID=UPI002614F55D|nr:flippase [Sulfuricurvum sp.]MDD2781654.1 flippase [Sulfuricurvum sp.]